MRRRPDLLIVIGLALLAGLLAVAVPAGPVRIGAGIVLELALTGYALAALVLGGEGRRPEHAELLLCTLGASLVVAALGGLLLDALPGHMDRLAWTLLFVCVTLASAGAALVLDRRAASQGTVEPRAQQSRPATVEPRAQQSRPPSRAVLEPRAQWSRSASSMRVGARTRALSLAAGGGGRLAVNALCAVVALGLAVAAIVVARNAADHAPGFSQLSTVPASKTARDPRLIVALTSHEAHKVRYLLVISEDGRPVLRHRLSLEPGAHWEMHTAPVAARTRKVLVRVFRGSGKPSLYTSFYPSKGVAS
jgi:hypothetical protein